LTSSPIISRSTSASPRTFHYATNPSPHQSPKVTASLPRRRSKHSLVLSPSGTLGSGHSPLHPQAQHTPKQYVGVDVATQYSPMEAFDPTVPLRGVRPSPPDRAPQPPLFATAMVDAAVPQPQSAVLEPPSEPNISPKRPENVQPAGNPLSPGKRRSSQELIRSTGSPVSAVAQSQASSPKRSRPTQGPPKVLPLKYEFCDVEDMVILIANMLAELIETNDSIAMKSGHLTRFHSR
jgi:hypothetical protein